MKHIQSKLWAMLLLTMSLLLPSAAWADGKHKLTVKASPSMAGSFNTDAAELIAGETIHLYAYKGTNGNFDFVQWKDNTGAVVSKDQDFTYMMPDHDVTLTAEYSYNPVNPANPASNYWDKEHGEVIADDFEAGSLHSAISQALNGSSTNDVTMITVAGRMNQYDFGIANNYSNCAILDLSRVAGATTVPSYAFDNSNLESVYLPASIENIGYYAFGNCQKLTALTIYAMTPPTLEEEVFNGVPEGLVVYVPAASIGQYQDTEQWSKFTLLPIQEDIRSISVALPQEAKAADYDKMWLELTNTKSGQRLHYIMTDRSQYTFANIIKNTSWNVTLRNERGDVFGRIDNVEVKDEDVSVSFASLTKPQTVTIAVQTPDGKNVTGQTQITWTDTAGNYMAQGASLTALPAGFQLNYRVALSQDLAMLYDSPKTTAYTLKDGGNNLTARLAGIKQVTISGKVKDVSTGMALNGAVVSASQTFAGKYSKTVNAKTDANGAFTMTVANVPTSLAFAATDYMSQSISMEPLAANETAKTLDDVSLKPISGATITVSFSYTTVDDETQNWYSDYQNVGYTLFNKTQGKAISQYNVQYPQIVLLEEVNGGDVLELTAESKTGAFKPVKATATISAEQKAEATFALVQLGQLKAEYVQSGNASVVASLYDSTGKLLKTYSYQDMSLTVSDLADGSYTLVSMGSSQFFNSIYSLAQLPQSGLKAGTDYVQNAVTIESGKVTELKIDLVPKLDESKFYYTGDNTSFTVNKPSIVAGNYLTLTGRIDFRQAYASGVSNVQLIVDLPETSEFVENSVMVGNSTSSYTLNGHQLTIPLARYTDRVRFCVIPTAGGDYAPSAFAQFDLNGKTIKQPIGSANYTAKDLSISVPSTVAKKEIPVSGTAVGQSQVEIYDNGVLIGQTTSRADGTWSTTCELNEPYNLSTHEINAKVLTKGGIELLSESKECMYDRFSIEAKTVSMSFYNGWLRKNVDVVFDLQSKTANASSYMFYTTTDVTFVADLTNNNPSIVTGVTIRVYTDKNNWYNLTATYNENIDRWVAVRRFGSSELPTGVKVNVTSNSEAKADIAKATSLYDNVDEYIAEMREEDATFTQLSNEIDQELAKENYDHEKVMQLLTQFTGSPAESSDYQTLMKLDDNAFDAYIKQLLKDDKELKEYGEELAELYATVESHNRYSSSSETLPDGSILLRKVSKCDALTVDNLITQGFSQVPTTEGSLLVKTTDDTYEVVDLTNSIRFTYTLTEGSSTTTRGSKAITRYGWGDFIVDRLKQAFQTIVTDMDNMSQLYSKANRERKYYLDLFTKKEKGCKEALDCVNKKLESAIGLKEVQLKNQRASILKQLKKIEKDKARTMKLPRSLARINKVIFELQELAKLYEMIIGYHDKIEALKVAECTRKENPRLAEILDGMIERVKKEYTDYAIWRGSLYVVSKVGDIALGKLPVIGFILNMLEDAATNIRDEQFIKWTGNDIEMIKKNIKLGEAKCKKEKDEPEEPEEPKEPEDNNDFDDNDPPQPQIPPIRDPSGYVYEGVFSNRLQGVTATCYYKETVEDMYGDLHENVVKWDAEEYAQQNPLFTDENGYYRWDVPNGLWQVKFEKEGYETTYSEWLPVPPPQLDINIAMKQNVQPTVKAARAFEQAVELEFDKYMQSELLTAENITVMVGSTAVEGTVELLNEEVTREGETETFASKVRFEAAKPFDGKEVTLMVSNRVRSYAGIRMQDDFSQKFTVEKEIKQILSGSLPALGYGEKATLTVSVLPADASKGKLLTVKSSSPMILAVEAEQVVIDDDGKAEIRVSGELPGTAALTFTVEGTDKTAQTIVSVGQKTFMTVSTPTASVASGSVVEKGTTITLTCETENATIYYTLDGSCPCDNTDARKVYDGTPIVINENVTINAMAVAPGMADSEVAEFIYIVDESNGIEEVTLSNQIQVYPLPVRDKLNVTACGKTIKSVTISAMNGVLVASANKPATKVTLDVNNITAGVYIVYIATESGVSHRKILKVD